MSSAVFKIKQYQDGLIITIVSNEVEIERLLLEVNADPHIGVDWIRDNGELYLAGNWLTQCGLTGQPLAINVMPGNVVLQAYQGNMLA
ncbi:SymE family type I addiction module toxin [Serratia silvae]|uniref:SymE family type I addiction module toxin n=1 Tax=Serratia silvae TaxID=2824122 RepID=UPI00200E5A92|nr:SymE family type I addiction module toxin [Serratia silvae]